ncbi:hypothetical protein Gbro_4867 (plasmid) [Gordonia bronchialis DSM 43247]|uniref:Uncharacterized protein n=1 Tax=Gordonia bronchialis (strain ATCC 25592 / DSM 43247 / BCRC 13721 / JCM 3198 / KCTC 3076 / NBRC 16047 / NCTC 10667) TaxID=526226 RepID=D0LFD1_GORB4|nr:hypothetical protein [Gordonia bronchialis]ACY23980.1 hypothetical protein Gbro_4867 [Gordonia bronchialis DSM 43247]QGS27307.1 hypothetical protein FOB84_24295 [Gordonia bronchialis]STS10858.1 Uncharacterised protein [Gordonia bronchialis]
MTDRKLFLGILLVIGLLIALCVVLNVMVGPPPLAGVRIHPVGAVLPESVGGGW